MTQAPETCRRCGRDLLHMPDRGNYCCCLKPAAPHTAAPAADRAVSALVQRLNDEADQCRNAGANDIAGLLDEAARTLSPPADRAKLAKEAKEHLHGAIRAARSGISKMSMDIQVDECEDRIDALARSTDAPSEPSASAFEARVTDLQSKAFMPFAQAAELAASELGPVLCWVHEWGAIGLPLGHASRVTCFAAFNTLPEAIAASEACEFNDRLIPIFEPGAQQELVGEVVIGPKGDVEGWTVVKWGEKGCPPVGSKLYTSVLATPPATATSTPCASGEPAHSDAWIEAAFRYCGGKWDGDRWVIEDADLHPFARTMLGATQAPAVPATDAPRNPKAATGKDLAIYKSIADNYDRATTAPAEAPPTIKGAWIDGGYVIVTPAGWGDDKAIAVKAAILAHFPVDPKFTPQAASTGGKS